jgi:hypothetical protein
MPPLIEARAFGPRLSSSVAKVIAISAKAPATANHPIIG